MKITPELYCYDIEVTRDFYLDVLHMKIKYERPEDQFIYFIREGLGIMVEQYNSPDRKWITGELERPFGRGVNFQWEVADIELFYDHVKRNAPNSVFLNLEKKEYRKNDSIIIQKQFIVQDPDGYLFRFCD